MRSLNLAGKFLFFAVICILPPLSAFAQAFPPLDPVFTYRTDSESLSPHEMIQLAVQFSEYPASGMERYMNEYLELESEVKSDRFMSMPEKQRAEAVLSLMYEKKLRKYRENQTHVTVMLDEGTYNCVSSSVLYCALAKASGLTVSANRALNHCFCSVLIDGTLIDVETTNPMGFEPGSKKQLSRGSSGTAYAVVPVRQYNGRYPISDMMLVSLVARNRSSSAMDRNDYDTAVSSAVTRLDFLEAERGTEHDDSRADFDITCSNYAASLQRSQKHYESLLWLDAVIERYGISDGLIQAFQDAAYNAVLYFCNQGDFDFAATLYGSHMDLLDAENRSTIGQVIFISRMQENLKTIPDDGLKLEYLRKLENAPEAADPVIQKQLYALKENCHMQRIARSANSSEYAEALAFAREAVQEMPSSSRMKTLLQQCEKNYAATIHNQFARMANSGQYQSARDVLQQGLRELPENSTLRNDMKRLDQIQNSGR